MIGVIKLTHIIVNKFMNNKCIDTQINEKRKERTSRFRDKSFINMLV